MSVRNLRLSGADPTGMDFYLDGKRVTEMRLDGVVVWDVHNRFRVKLCRNSDGDMGIYFQLAHLVGCTKAEIDFGDGTTGTLDTENPYLLHTYDTGDEATIDIVATGLTSIEQNGLGDYTSWKTSITFPDGLTSIADYAFVQHASLREIDLPESLKSIGVFAFQGDSIESVDLHNVETIGRQAFLGNSLSTLKVPKSVTSVGQTAFGYCTKLSSVNVNQSCDISEYQFEYCTNLSNVTIGRHVTGIRGSAFVGCTSLESITIPSTVTRIYTYIFDAATHDIYFEGTRPSFVTACSGNINVWESKDTGTYTIHCTDGNMVF